MERTKLFSFVVALTLKGVQGQFVELISSHLYVACLDWKQILPQIHFEKNSVRGKEGSGE